MRGEATAPNPTPAPADTPPSTTVTTCDAQSPNVLDPGGEPSLAPGACLVSPNQQYQLIMQTDGNLVLYYQTSANTLWSSNTANNPGAFFRLQTNGFMGVLNSANSVTLWAPSEPWVGGPINAVLVLQDDGNLVLYDTQSGDVHALWATGTNGLKGATLTSCGAGAPSQLPTGLMDPGGCLISPNQQYELIMQTDGNLVLYYKTSANALWSSNTENNAGAFFRLQTNGFIGVLNSTNSATLWAPSEPWVGGPVNPVLVLQDDGNLVLYDTQAGDVHALWATATDNRGDKNLTTCDASAPSRLPGGEIGAGGCLISPNQQYELIMQTDGNLVLYYKTSGGPEWASNTEGNPGAYFGLPGTGQMAVRSSSFAQLWAPNEPWVDGDAYIDPVLVVQNDGNVVLYRTQQNSSGGLVALWATGTQEPSNGSILREGQTLHAGHSLASPNGHVTLVMQQDGNLVAEFNGDGATAYWATGSWGNPWAFLAMQGDGNLLLYQQGSTVGTGIGAIWGDGCPGCNQTYPQPGNYLAVQNDGNIVVYNASGQALWSSNTVVAASGSNLGSTLSVGQQMNGGDYMQSPNGEYQLYNQSNVVSGGTPGNLALYTDVPSTGAACQMDTLGSVTSIETSNNQVTESYAKGAYLTLTSSGNLIYYYTNTESGTNVSWSAGVSGGSLLTLQNDGNLVLYGTPPAPDEAAPVLWQWGTNTYRGNALCAGETLQQGQYVSYQADYMIMQTDGNLVVYPYGSSTAQWAAGTNGQGSDYAIQQTDGNFVIYHTGGGAIWSTASDQSTLSNSWTFQVGNTGVNNNNPGGQWALQVFNTGSGDYAWYADAKKPSGALVKPPATSQISHGAQAVLNLTTFILTG